MASGVDRVDGEQTATDAPPQTCDSVRTEMPHTHFSQAIQDMLTNQIMCDVTLKGMDNACEGIPCHRNIVSAHSSYFRTMFSIGMRECHEDEVCLKNIPFSILKTLIEYLYSFPIVIDASNVHDILAAAIFWDVLTLAETCFEFLEHQLDKKNCLRVFCSLHCESYKPSFVARAKELLLQNFIEIFSDGEFLELDKDKAILSGFVVETDNRGYHCR
ncbi:kelch-like protein 7 [Paramacrobiotus metropolitanus]|uniref:kelch-like protein 7 n=1 Tax=Paramacrobiotus metropolitanus TaxID=2943436 RepID=UPI00244615CD|nr:kelch-like protein 7 [Paramacrobiotus metropolitanus]